MSDAEIPADLIALKREFYATERKLAGLGDDSEAWNATHRRMGELAVQIHRHPALQALAGPDRLKLDSAASRAAREQLAAQDSAGG